MQRDQLRPLGGQCPEELHVAGQRQPREIDFEELGVASAIRRRVKHRVSVVEDVFGADGLAQVATAIWDESKCEALG